MNYQYNNHSYGALLLACLFGLIIGLYIKNPKESKEEKNYIEHQVKFKHYQDSVKQVIFKLEKQSMVLSDQSKVDSVKIRTLLIKLKDIKKVEEKELKAVDTLNNEELVKYFSDRYSKHN